MVPYMSYWCGGYRKQPSEMILLMHKIACYFAKQHYGECHMLTDSSSKDLFKDCGFTSIQVLPKIADIPIEYSATWSLGKIYAYRYLAEQKIHFLHLDYDVFLFKKLPDFIQNADSFVQCVEKNCFDWYGIAEFLKICSYKKIIEDNQSFFAFNMGIFGGKDSNYIKEYCELVLDIVFKIENRQFWIEGGVGHWTRAAIAEQWFLACFEKYKKQKITCLFDRDRIFGNSFPYEEDCAEYGYTHLWGVKDNPRWQNQIKQIVQKLNL